MSVYERITKRQRIWIDADGNALTEPERGGGGQRVIGRVADLVKPASDEEARTGRLALKEEVENLPIDEEAQAAIDLLKSKGLL